MYNCQVCGHTSEPGETLKKHIIYRRVPYSPSQKSVIGLHDLINPTRTEIAKEIPVCSQCQILLLGGIPLHMVLRQKNQERIGESERGIVYSLDKHNKFVERYGKKDVVEGPPLTTKYTKSKVS